MNIQEKLQEILIKFADENTSLFDASEAFLKELGIRYNRGAETSTTLNAIAPEKKIPKSAQEALNLLTATYFVGNINSKTFEENVQFDADLQKDLTDAKDEHYKGMFVFAVDLKADVKLTRTFAATLTRAFNRVAKQQPVVLFIRQNTKLSIATCERTPYKPQWLEGEKLGKVSVLMNVDCEKPHRGHLDILKGLNACLCCNFDQLYKFWMSQFNIAVLNKQFYTELQKWFYWAIDEIKLPDDKNTILTKSQINKNFIVRMLSRLMFCWFLKEKKDKNGNSVIDSQILELKDSATGKYFSIVKDLSDENFLCNSSYYRGILQNVFFCGLNSDTKKSKKDLKCCRFLPDSFDYNIILKIPFLNGSTFRPLEDDFFKDSIEDDVMRVPNYLFYGDAQHRGINEIFHDYKFTVEENTPGDVDIALDPEMLGMVFENLLAEIDPQSGDLATSIRKATGSFYTPRPVIQEMTNESLYQYLNRNIQGSEELKECLYELVYNDNKTTDKYDKQVVEALHNIRVLDPACGSGAFPMGMLQRIVDILRTVDPKSEMWLQLMLSPIDDIAVRERFQQQLSGSTDDYQRKLGIIRNCIYAIDIQPIAVQITKLRFFISLLANQEVDTAKANCGILPFPNMETKIVCADSLTNLQPDLFVSDAKQKLIVARQKYYQPNISSSVREEIAEEIAGVMDVVFPKFASQLGLKDICNKAVLKRWFIDANINAPFFDMETFFPEITGFDIVIGNPPYGGFKIPESVRTALSLGSNDPYGAFISRFLGNGNDTTPLKVGGTLAFIVSDTFMTIGSHLKLRQQMMHNRIHKMIRMCPKTFSATVNTVVIFCEKCQSNGSQYPIEGNVCTMADMTNIDIHEDYQYFTQILSQSMNMDADECISNAKYAIYRYPQTLISKCSNLPFFVASPKLFLLMQDVNLGSKQKYTTIDGKQIGYREITINNKGVELFKLGDISEVKVGLQTGDNHAYLFKEESARGSYRVIDQYRDFILTEADMEKIHSDNTLHLSIINQGISKKDRSTSRYFGGRYIVKYDKGGESDAEAGWIPNYCVPTEYYIDWSEDSVKRMKTLTIKQRDIADGKICKSKTPNKVCSRFQNASSYFCKGISFSWTGVYCPSFRISEGGPFDHGASAAFFPQSIPVEYAIGILASRLQRYLMRTIINHTVNFGIEDVKDICFPISESSDIIKNVSSIISKQKQNRFYDYASHEQLEIDKLVYEAYGLNDDDVREVETWYARRYPKLAAAQRANLEKVRQS